MNLTDIDKNKLENIKQLATDMAYSLFGDSIDFDPGSVVHKLVVEPNSVFNYLQLEEVERVLESNSLARTLNNPNADEATVNNLLSNYFIERREGTQASGRVRIVLSDNRYTPIPSNILFDVAGQSFAPVGSFVGVTSADEVGSGSTVLIQPYINNTFSFVIDVVAVEPGSSGNISKDVILGFPPIQSNITQVISATSFSGGTDTETNSQLLERALTAIVSRGNSNRFSIDSTIRSQFPNVITTSVLGGQDKEVRRSTNFFNTTYNSVDIYVKTTHAPLEADTIKTFKYDENSNTWSTTFLSNEFPVIVAVIDVIDVQTELPVHDFTYQVENRSGYGFSPDQLVRVSFEGTFVPVGSGERDLSVSFLFVPGIDSVSNYINSREVRPISGDIVVKAANICDVYMDIVIERDTQEQVIDADEIKLAIVNSVNNMGFRSGKLSSGTVLQAIYSVIPRYYAVKQPLNLRCFLYHQTGSTMLFSDQTNELVIPNMYDRGISNRTTVFSAVADNISVTIVDVV